MDKFEEFQSTLAKSNEVFTTFRQEMEKVRQRNSSVSQLLMIVGRFHLFLVSLLAVNCLDLPPDDQKDQDAGEGNHTVEDQVGD